MARLTRYFIIALLGAALLGAGLFWPARQRVEARSVPSNKIMTCTQNRGASFPFPSRGSTVLKPISCFRITGPGIVQLSMDDVLEVPATIVLNNQTLSQVTEHDLTALQANRGILEVWLDVQGSGWSKLPATYNAANHTYEFTAEAAVYTYYFMLPTSDASVAEARLLTPEETATSIALTDAASTVTAQAGTNAAGTVTAQAATDIAGTGTATAATATSQAATDTAATATSQAATDTAGTATANAQTATSQAATNTAGTATAAAATGTATAQTATSVAATNAAGTSTATAQTATSAVLTATAAAPTNAAATTTAAAATNAAATNIAGTATAAAPTNNAATATAAAATNVAGTNIARTATALAATNTTPTRTNTPITPTLTATSAVTTAQCASSTTIPQPIPSSGSNILKAINCFNITGTGSATISLTQVLTSPISGVTSTDISTIVANPGLMETWIATDTAWSAKVGSTYNASSLSYSVPVSGTVTRIFFLYPFAQGTTTPTTSTTTSTGTTTPTSSTSSVTKCADGTTLSSPYPQNDSGEFLRVTCYTVTGPGTFSVSLTQVLGDAGSNVGSDSQTTIQNNPSGMQVWRMGSWFLVNSSYNSGTQTYTFEAISGAQIYVFFYAPITRRVGAQGYSFAASAGTTTGNVTDLLPTQLIVDNPPRATLATLGIFLMVLGLFPVMRKPQLIRA